MADGSFPWRGPVVDTYGGPAWGDVHRRRTWHGERAVFTRRHLPDVRAGGVQVIVQPVLSYESLEELFAEVDESEGALRVATTAAEIRAGVEAGALVFVICLNDRSIDGRPDRLPLLHRIGGRIFSYSHNRRNLLADGCGERNDGGLSHLGLEVLKELERLRILVDISHLSVRSFWDVVKHGERPFLATHSNARAVCDHPRNLTDDQIRALAERGGVQGINFYPGFVKSHNPTIDDIVEHIEYIAELVGPEHVALGPDFIDTVADTVETALRNADPTGTIYAGSHSFPVGAESISRFSDVGRKLLDRGWKREHVELVMGGNFMRLFEAVCG